MAILYRTTEVTNISVLVSIKRTPWQAAYLLVRFLVVVDANISDIKLLLL